ncbi:unnamed protein product [Caretta caretta]
MPMGLTSLFTTHSNLTHDDNNTESFLCIAMAAVPNDPANTDLTREFQGMATFTLKGQILFRVAVVLEPVQGKERCFYSTKNGPNPQLGAPLLEIPTNATDDVIVGVMPWQPLSISSTNLIHHQTGVSGNDGRGKHGDTQPRLIHLLNPRFKAVQQWNLFERHSQV